VKFPTNIVAGETFLVQCDDLDYTTVSIYLRGPSSVNATANLDVADYWQFALDSSAWLPGSYQFEIWGTLGEAKCYIGRYPLTVLASLSASDGPVDVRTETEKVVDALEKKIAGIALCDEDQSVLRYRLNNRELENYSILDLRRLLALYKNRLIRERRKARGLTGPGPSMKARI